MIKFYSQNGEDSILWSIFNNKTSGFFVDVGALDGTRFSNTYSFERAGWNGICIEAHPGYIDILKKNRPNSIVSHAAISNKNKGSATFYANYRGALSTLIGDLKKVFGKKYKASKPEWKTIKVPMKMLTTIFINHKIKDIDVMSIDIEGGELDALDGLNFNLFRPRIFVIEAIDKNREKLTTQKMTKEGYILSRKVSNNLFYCRDTKDSSIVRNAPLSKKLIHTPHPCDL